MSELIQHQCVREHGVQTHVSAASWSVLRLLLESVDSVLHENKRLLCNKRNNGEVPAKGTPALKFVGLIGCNKWSIWSWVEKLSLL